MAFDHRTGYFALAGLVLSTGGVLLQEPLLSLSLKGTQNFTSLLSVSYAYLFVLNPLSFYLNVLLLILHVAGHATAPVAPIPLFLMNHLPKAAQLFSFFTLLFGLPLWIQAAVTEESVDLAIVAALLCLALVTILIFILKKLLISCCHTGRGFVPFVFVLCISTGILIFFDSNINTSFQFPLSFINFIIFVLGTALLILWMSTPGQQAAMQAEHPSIVALSVAFSTLLVGVYINYWWHPDMGVVSGILG